MSNLFNRNSVQAQGIRLGLERFRGETETASSSRLMSDRNKCFYQTMAIHPPQTIAPPQTFPRGWVRSLALATLALGTGVEGLVLTKFKQQQSEMEIA